MRAVRAEVPALIVRRAHAGLARMARRARGSALHRGNAVECAICRSTYRELAPAHGPNRVCWACGSMERDRLLWFFFDQNPDLLRGGQRVLHVAPEPSLRPRLERHAREYVSGDLEAEFGALRLDVTDLPFGDGYFDALVCNHVLEHVPDDRRAMGELCRVLSRDGWAILLVPDVAAERTHEDASVGPARRRELFGQADHVRRYGWDYLDRLQSAGFRPQVIDMGERLTDQTISRHRLRKFGEIEPIFLCRRA